MHSHRLHTLSITLAALLWTTLVPEAAAQSPRRIGIVVTTVVNVGENEVDELSGALGQALEQSLGVVVTAGPETRRRLPSEGLSEGCIGDAACRADLGERLDADGLLMLVVARVGNRIQIDATWVDVASGKLASRPAVVLEAGANRAAVLRVAAQTLLPHLQPLPTLSDVKAPTPAPTSEPRPRLVRRERRMTAGTWIMTGISVAALGGSLGLGYLNMTQYDELEAVVEGDRDRVGLGAQAGRVEGDGHGARPAAAGDGQPGHRAHGEVGAGGQGDGEVAGGDGLVAVVGDGDALGLAGAAVPALVGVGEGGRGDRELGREAVAGEIEGVGAVVVIVDGDRAGVGGAVDRVVGDVDGERVAGVEGDRHRRGGGELAAARAHDEAVDGGGAGGVGEDDGVHRRRRADRDVAEVAAGRGRGFGEQGHPSYPTLCRGRFVVNGDTYYPFEEPTSLNTLELLPRLQAMGVAAIKIEGRQRSPVYVETVTRVWREALYACARDRERFRVKPAWQEALAGISEGRQCTLGAYHRPWK